MKRTGKIRKWGLFRQVRLVSTKSLAHALFLVLTKLIDANRQKNCKKIPKKFQKHEKNPQFPGI
jgi:hypothetical protein